MPYSYVQAISEIRKLSFFGSKPGLERISALLPLLGNPQKRLRVISVAGSNGKGSVTAMLSSCLSAAGYHTGAYTSPHLVDFRERICVDGKKITEREFAEIYARTRRAARALSPRLQPTLFELTTAMALLYFAEKKCDFAVLEAGLGGRLDATNAARAEMVVIPSISLEHTQILGKTLREIAAEKAGLVKKGSLVVIGEMDEEAFHEIKRACFVKGARVIQAEREVRLESIRLHKFGSEFKAKRKRDYDVRLSLAGGHQILNASCALCACEELGLPKRAIEKGLKAARISGRMQVISRKPLVVLDAAHNPGAFSALAASLSLFREKPLVLVLGMMRDKDIPGSLAHISSVFDAIVVNQPKLARAASAKSVAKLASCACKRVIIVKGARKSLSAARKLAGRQGCVVVAGSIYMLSEMLGSKEVLGQ